MLRTLFSLGLVLTVAGAGCGPTVGGGNTGSTGNVTGTTGNSNGTTGSSTGTTGSSTGTTGSSTGTTGSSTGTTGSSTGTTGSSTGTTGSSTGTTGSSTGTTGSSTGTTGSSTGTTGSSTGTTGSGTGSTGTTGGSTGGTTGGSMPTTVGPGTYDTVTQFNFLDALPPDVEAAIKLALEFTSSPGDGLLDVADQIPVIKYVVDAIDLFSGIRAKIVMGINDYINDWSGGMLTTMQQLSMDIESALRGLKSKNHLVFAKPDGSGNMVVQDTLVELIFTYQGTDYFYPQNANAMTTATLKGLQLSIAGHTYDKGVRVGGMLVDLIDNVALPQLTGVNSLGELLNQLVNCGGVGTEVWSYIYDVCLGDQCIGDYISGDDIAKLCMNALDAVGQSIENQISQLDAPGMMSLSDGTCLAVENKGHTGHADTFMTGKWTLTLPIGVGTLPLPGDFTGVLGPDAGSH
jgi:hypothetical protein